MAIPRKRETPVVHYGNVRALVVHNACRKLSSFAEHKPRPIKKEKMSQRARKGGSLAGPHGIPE